MLCAYCLAGYFACHWSTISRSYHNQIVDKLHSGDTSALRTCVQVRVRQRSKPRQSTGVAGVGAVWHRCGALSNTGPHLLLLAVSDVVGHHNGGRRTTQVSTSDDLQRKPSPQIRRRAVWYDVKVMAICKMLGRAIRMLC